MNSRQRRTRLKRLRRVNKKLDVHNSTQSAKPRNCTANRAAEPCAFCDRPAAWWNLAVPFTDPQHATAVSDRALSIATCRIHRGRAYPDVLLCTFRPLADGPYTPEQQCAAFGCTVDHPAES